MVCFLLVLILFCQEIVSGKSETNCSFVSNATLNHKSMSLNVYTIVARVDGSIPSAGREREEQ